MLKEPSDYDDWLSTLKEHNLQYFLEGGQAVNLWGLRYLEDIPELKDLLPFNSKDCDIWVNHTTLREIPKVLKGKLTKGTSPVDGQIGIFCCEEDQEKKMDLLSGVYGIDPAKIDHVLKRCYPIADYVVIDPLYLFKGKCHNWSQLPQSGRQDKKHLDMLSLIIPQHFLFLLSVAEDETTELTDRHLIKEIKFFLEFKKDHVVRQSLTRLNLSLLDLLPIEHLKSSQLAKMSRFAENL